MYIRMSKFNQKWLSKLLGFFHQCWCAHMQQQQQWLASLKWITVKRCMAALLVFSIISIIFYMHYLVQLSFQNKSRPEPFIQCHVPSSMMGTPDHRSAARLRIDPKVLVVIETPDSRLGREIAELLVYNRIKSEILVIGAPVIHKTPENVNQSAHKIDMSGKPLPVLTNLDRGKYSVVVFDNLNSYVYMDKWNRGLLDKYCRDYGVGIVGFNYPNEETLVGAQLSGFPLFVHTNLRLKDAILNAASPVLRVLRPGNTVWGALPGENWMVFTPNHTTYEPLVWATQIMEHEDSIRRLPVVLHDTGSFDGIQRVLFGSGLTFWLHRLLLLDALSYLSHGQISISLQRYILIDIDDIFVGERGTRLKKDDVEALLETQERIQRIIPGFRFNLGFSGKYFHHGTQEENMGDDILLQNVGSFTWFCHMWSHQQPHLYDNVTYLETEMGLNHAFAEEHGIPVDSGYSISPHHSGVYPVHEILYEAWKNVWNVKVTATEEYPHLRPARLRKGFIHRNVMVLPRQTCGLFTHTITIERYPGGREKLDESIQGGELFQTVVFNPINIFMTHMSNYGNDRLGLYTFESVLRFVQCWTNLRLLTASPVQLGEKYFKMYPDEGNPLWGNPCYDARHLKIWFPKPCDQLPHFLIIGPQKTGTTALYTFLSIHPNITSNYPNADTFEEIQFFSGNNYYRGLEWYMSFFPSLHNGTFQYLFEKSATYFEGELVPRRARALLPHAKLVTILTSPTNRAYSWYQHARAHGNQMALDYSFHQVVTANDTAPKPLRELRNRCLHPGKYSQHLERWLLYFPAQQIYVIDGDQLKSNPVKTMVDLQHFLNITPSLNYSSQLRFNPKKGFFCQVMETNQTKCLGRSKGRKYSAMEERTLKFLQRYYLSHNTALMKLLKRITFWSFPSWLREELAESAST
ncbi:hypothetical protein PR048_020137 [Dryococelus australis]|uniref:[heparan sulfate]-glucosamine N-sulfotransferase n=1 Tax=Dryococelus australis TaxID=614101 RepID=A0ABQ9H5F8_9NEOP|nr:hypothetical protein PR048_020137 [Dryococelus australis]